MDDTFWRERDTTHHDRMIQRLSRLGVPVNVLDQGPCGLVKFSKSKTECVEDLVSAILPPDDEELDEYIVPESLAWLQWLMFGDDPKVVFEHFAEIGASERGVCGAVWGSNDIAYRCRTCEQDPSCAICVPCFENGNHKDHDYSIMYTGGGCCDCGDITAWKREGFCSKHKGAEQIQPLPKHIAESLGPILDILLCCWKEKLLSIVIVSDDSPRAVSVSDKSVEALDLWTAALVEMLLDFCKRSESLLNFISERIYSTPNLLDGLLSTEKFLNDDLVGELHELLLKMLGDPVFKYEFAKVFVAYYPTVVNAAVSEGSDTAFKKYPLLSTFSVQILTVPTLTPRLVEEMNLLGMLLQSLQTIFISCAGEDGRLEVVKWENLYETTLRVVEDIRFVMSQSVVPKYMCHSRQDLVKMWMKLLVSVQGMNPLKRETGDHVEYEDQNFHLPFALCHSISNILSLIVAGAFSWNGNDDNREKTFFSTYNHEFEDQENVRHAKVGRLSQDSSVSSISGKSIIDHESRAPDSDSSIIAPSALWVIHECLKSVENWLILDDDEGSINSLSFKTSNSSGLELELSRYHGNLDAYGAGDDNHMEGNRSGEIEGFRVLSSQEWVDITYDVSTQEISVHIPLHRFLSIALHRALKDCCGKTLSSSNAGSVNSGDPYVASCGDILGQILDGCHPNGFSSIVMEHLLRIRVFNAQVHAGMWRRNGDDPILFSEWYRSIRWSGQGQELDLFLLQCCAALAPPDLYVHRIVERFGLTNYLSLDFRQSEEHESDVMAEMLTLLIHIVSERGFCGLTNTECLQRELVFKLATGDATRSQLIKSLPRDLSKDNELQNVLDRVAEYSHPSGMSQGIYKLRSSYWRELDLYHPRWNLRDRQVAEERFSQFCNVSALTTQLPRWTKTYYPLRVIAKIATCKTMLQVIRAVLFYAAFAEELTTQGSPDSVLLTVLHLLALALDVCRVHRASGDTSCYVGDLIPILAFATEEIITTEEGDGSLSLLSLLVLLMRLHEANETKHLTEAGNFSLSSLVLSLIKTFVELEPACLTQLQILDPQLAHEFSHAVVNDNARESEFASEREMRKAKSREKQAAIMEQMRAQQAKFLDTIQSTGDDEMDDVQHEQDICNSEVTNDAKESPQVNCCLCHDPQSGTPVSFLVLLQKSRLLGFVNRETPSWDQVSSSGQEEHVFRNTNRESVLFPGSIYCSSDIRLAPQLELVETAVENFSSIGQSAEVNAFVGLVKIRYPMKDIEVPCMPKDEEERAPSVEALEEHIYSLIREFQSNLDVSGSEKINASVESLLLGKYIAALPKEAVDYLQAESSRSAGGMQQEFSTPLGAGYDNFIANGFDGVYISSCRHAVHQGCLDRYMSSVGERYNRRITFQGRYIVDPNWGEFLCPVCRGLANSILPASPGFERKISRSSAASNTYFVGSGHPSASSDFVSSLRLQDGLLLVKRAANIAAHYDSLRSLPTSNVEINPNLEPVIRLLCGMYYPYQEKIIESGRISHSLLLWDMLKYSLMSSEIAARSGESSLNPNYSFGALYEELKSSGGFILSLLLDVVQSMRKTHSTTALLRLQGIQFFAQSLFPDSSPSYLSSYSCRQGMLHILERVDPKLQYPDSQLCRRASEPILTHDAFSSLMWLLFCLPWPMLYCEESYLSLVHVFYVVSVIQAISVCRGKGKSVGTDPRFRDGLFTDICQQTGNRAKALDRFGCRHLNPDYDINDSVRSLTYPYLRRCALLWKLICSKQMQFSDGVDSWVESLCDLDQTTTSNDELSEVEKLEKMLNIPSLDVICNDQGTRELASRWLTHFAEVLQARRCKGVIKCNPAVPFKLMALPHLYQNILQRYIKMHCPECGSIKEEPALCLLCGRLCSPSWKTCCRESGCQTHAMTCGAGIGVFLLVRKTTILLQRSGRQAPWPSLYLDAFGEEDVQMDRGKPLYLNEERYASLCRMVASHGLDRSSRLLRTDLILVSNPYPIDSRITELTKQVNKETMACRCGYIKRNAAYFIHQRGNHLYCTMTSFSIALAVKLSCNIFRGNFSIRCWLHHHLLGGMP